MGDTKITNAAKIPHDILAHGVLLMHLVQKNIVPKVVGKVTLPQF